MDREHDYVINFNQKNTSVSLVLHYWRK
jgi:hypothetical protein